MLGRQERGQDVLFVAGSMKDLIPDEHILKKIDAVLDLSWLRAEVEDLYCDHNGRPGIDPDAAGGRFRGDRFEARPRRALQRQSDVAGVFGLFNDQAGRKVDCDL
jgi:hypothetical protein